MNTRSKSDKTKVDDLYKNALEKVKTKTDNSTPHTSTPTGSCKAILKSVKFTPDTPEISEDKTLLTRSFNSMIEGSASSLDPLDETIRSIHQTDYNFSSNKTANIMAHHNPLATLKYAVEAVPFFDGQNIPLTYFIEGCEEAKSMLPEEAEPQFTKIIRTRIVGEARRTIQDQDFDSVAQLTKYLEQIYGPSKNIYQLQGELGCIYQKNEEDIVTYANRVKILGKQILEAHKNSGNTLPGQNIKASLEKDMCKCFIRGLKPEIEQRIKRDLDVQATVADALRIERELREMTDLRQGQSSSGKPSSTNRLRETCQICYKEGHLASNCRKLNQFSQQPYNKSALRTEILICQICKKRGHSADKCRLRDPQNGRSVNIVRESNIVCQLCSKSGHVAKTCRENTSDRVKLSVVCQWCDKPGHSANNCWKKLNEQQNKNHKPKVTCQVCNNLGHTAKECRFKLEQKTTPKDTLFCRYCKEGHVLENCELRIASNNRRKFNNQGNSNGPLKSGVQQGPERTSHPSTSQETS